MATKSPPNATEVNSKNSSGSEIQDNRALNFAFKAIRAIEFWGNKLPHPFWLFCILAAILVVLSALFQALGVSAVSPSTGETIAINSLLSREGMQVIVGDVVENFASFPPLATILTTMLGIVIAEKSGLFNSVLRMTVTKVPARYTTFALSYAGMIGHVAGDAAYVTLIPLGAIVFRAIGRSPILGAIVAFVSISAGYDASPSLTTTDILLSSISTAAAHTIDPSAYVTPTSNYFFALASSILISLTITFVVEKFLARRPDLEVEEGIKLDEEATSEEVLIISEHEQRALRVAGLVALGFSVILVLLLAFPSSPFRGEGDGILNSLS
ncbi:MAG: AbgT family transporter [Corynebacterium sp.]|nr:AbgT family transporter [Corynebacterium sp.]